MAPFLHDKPSVSLLRGMISDIKWIMTFQPCQIIKGLLDFGVDYEYAKQVAKFGSILRLYRLKAQIF